jgi:hypothetical protein
MGQHFPRIVFFTVVLSACIITAGCFGLLTAEGPLAKYALSSHAQPDQASLPTPVTIETTLGGTPLETPIITATPTEDPFSYHPLRVIPQAGDAREYRTFSFRYRTDDYTVKVPVNLSIYRAANMSGNKQMIIDDKEVGLFYRQMIEDPAMEPFYRDLSKEVRNLRYKGGKTLSDDEYLEMVTSFVQQIPYDTTTTGPPRYPVEVIYDWKGDCDEKSILLAGLLSRDGYDVGLLIFPSLKHATAGIRIHLATSNPSFKVFSDGKRDYVYIETTTTRLIGFYPEEYENASRPIVVPVGNGTIGYGKINYVMKAFYDIKTIKTNIKAYEDRVAAGQTMFTWDATAYASYVNTYSFVISTNDRFAAIEAIRESELPHHSACMSCN